MHPRLGFIRCMREYVTRQTFRHQLLNFGHKDKKEQMTKESFATETARKLHRLKMREMHNFREKSRRTLDSLFSFGRIVLKQTILGFHRTRSRLVLCRNTYLVLFSLAICV